MTGSKLEFRKRNGSDTLPPSLALRTPIESGPPPMV